MHASRTRFLAPVFERARQQRRGAVESPLRTAGFRAGPPEPKPDRVPAEFNGTDYVAFLLHVDAEIEHALMVQYLYGAYSLGGPQVPAAWQAKVRGWQDIVLGIAKEEMGHLMSVQNVLRLIGAPLNFAREDFPWDTPFYPFPFALEPLSLDSLAKYVFAESPEGWIDGDDPLAREIKQRLGPVDGTGHRVGALFDLVLELIQDPKIVPDSVFDGGTYPFQASFDEWGRGYRGGARGNPSGQGPAGTPDVLVVPLASRDDAVAALRQIAEQGENTKEGGDPSHFQRFLTVYREMKEALAEIAASGNPGAALTRPVATNPFVDPVETDASNASTNGECSVRRDAITHPTTVPWAHLFNLRYRFLLNLLTHSFLLEGGYNNAGAISPRGMIVNSAFGEMYNLRALSHMLVSLPLTPEPSPKRAGPPFLLPYTLELPGGERNRWRQHRDLLEASLTLVDTLLAVSPDQTKYLSGLREADRKLIDLIAALPGH